MKLLEVLKELQGTHYLGPHGEALTLELLPPAPKQPESGSPDWLGQALQESAGLKNCAHVHGNIDLSGHDPGWEMEDLFIEMVTVAVDGVGNAWNVEVDRFGQIRNWGAVYFLCHDPAVLVWVAADIVELLQACRPPVGQSLWSRSHEHARRIWASNPGLIEGERAREHPDPELREWSRQLGSNWDIFDFRGAREGTGLSWGRWGPDTRLLRHPQEWWVAIRRPDIPVAQQKSWLQRLFSR